MNLLKIDSSVVAPAHRRRLYWTNIPNATVPEPAGLDYADILENGFVDRDNANVLLSGNVTLTNGIFRHFKMSIGNIIYKDRDFAELPTEEKLLRYPQILANSGYEGKARGIKDDLAFPNGCYRNPTIKEYSRMMTIPDEYVDGVAGVSKTEKQKTLGLAFTVDVVAHLFQGLNKCFKNDVRI